MATQSKEEILANFQSITGIDDLGEAFSHLENADWDLVSAIQHVIPQDNMEMGRPPNDNDEEDDVVEIQGGDGHGHGGGGGRHTDNCNPPPPSTFGRSPVVVTTTSTQGGILEQNPFAQNNIHNSNNWISTSHPRNHRNTSTSSQHINSSNINENNSTTTTGLMVTPSDVDMNDLTLGGGGGGGGGVDMEDEGGSSNVSHSSSSAIGGGGGPIATCSSSTSNPSLINNNNKLLHFNIHFDQRIFEIRLPSSATIEQLKRKILDVVGVPICRQALRGWPPGKMAETQKMSTKLAHLGLSSRNDLVLNDLTEEGYIMDDTEKNEIARRMDLTFKLTIVEQPNGVRHELNFLGRTTIQEVKTNVFYVTDIPVRHQIWTGWPTGGCNLNDITLAQSGIQLAHNFTLQNATNNTKNESQSSSANVVANNLNDIVNNPTTPANMNSAMGLDTDSSADEFEDASDFNNCEEFFIDPPTTQPTVRHLIANNVINETTGTIQFVDNYKQRYGEPMPIFFIGSLEEALNEACHKPARGRKLLAIYLHHGESILANVFCSHLMMHESILQTFAENFLLYGWDLTHESNKHLFLSSVTAGISSTASLTVRNISIDKLPSILIIGKSRLSGRSTCEVLSVIHGNVGLDDLLSRLLESVEMYTEQLQVEIAEEDARAARDQVKAEQDMAYQEALQADIAKEAAKRQKEAAMAAERKRIESEKAEENARRESIRLVAEQLLPNEPLETDTEITKIRVRKPTGEFFERRFFTTNTLQDLFNFVASQGFLIEEYKVISSWPRRDLTSVDDATQTLLHLKLCPQETVILEER